MHSPIPSTSPRKTRTVRIGLVVDHPLRDLDGLCLVAQLLTERGVEVVLLPFYTQHFDLPNLDLDLIVLNYVRPANRALVEAAAARGIALAVLDTEGGLIPEDGPTSASGIATFLRESGLDQQLALYLFWGEHLRDRIIAETALPPDRAIVTGCPRFDLARHGSLDQRRGRGHILVNTNFPVVNSGHSQSFMGNSRVDVDALRSVGFNEREIADLAENVRSVMERMIETIHTLAQARPARRFVIRPHPFEFVQPYEEAFAQCRNIRVERKGSALEALAKAECLLHVNCTTAIEACIAGVPPISLDFINEARLRSMALLPSQISHPASSLAQALELIDRAGELSPGVEQERITRYFGPLDGAAAHRVAEALLHSSPRMAAPTQPPSPSAGLRRGMSRLLGQTIGSRVIEGVRRTIRPSRAIKAFGSAEVRARIEEYAQARGRNPAKIEHSRSAIGLPIMALKLSPP